MKYMEMLKSKKAHQGVLSKLTKPPSVSFDSEGGRGFYEKNNPHNLPENCPLIDGPVPAGCAFEKNFFVQLVRERVLPVGGPCPLRSVCKLSKRGTK